MSALSVAILCQAGPAVGFGHLRRCLTLADALRRRGGDVRFLVNGEDGTPSLVARHGFPAAVIETIPGALRGLASDPAGLVIDVLNLREAAAALARGRARALAVITETDGPLPEADLIVDSRFSAEEKTASCPSGTVGLFGPRYALLREEFADEPARSIAPSIARILITVGGSDPHGLSARLMDLAWKAAPEAVLDVVVGPFVADAGPVEALAASRPGRARLHRHPEGMRGLMLDADLALSAGGQTLFELAATASPVVAIQVAANQAPNLHALAARGALCLAGEVSDPDLDTKVSEALRGLRDPAARARMGDRGRAGVDGRGAGRVADAMLEVFGRSPSRSETRR